LEIDRERERERERGMAVKKTNIWHVGAHSRNLELVPIAVFNESCRTLLCQSPLGLGT